MKPIRRPVGNRPARAGLELRGRPASLRLSATEAHIAPRGKERDDERDHDRQAAVARPANSGERRRARKQARDSDCPQRVEGTVHAGLAREPRPALAVALDEVDVVRQHQDEQQHSHNVICSNVFWL